MKGAVSGCPLLGESWHLLFTEGRNEFSTRKKHHKNSSLHLTAESQQKVDGKHTLVTKKRVVKQGKSVV